MAFGENKLKIVWICNFMNQTIQKKLGMDGNEKEFGPWITLGIEEVKKRNDIELHVISPCYRILRNCKFTDKNIKYYFIRIGIPFMRTAWRAWFNFDLWSNYYFFNLQVKKLVKRINPDLVNLYGAENAHYSSSILGIKGYPILVTIQGFISLSNLDYHRKAAGIKKRIQIEKRILKELKYFGIEASFIEKYIRTFNPYARIFWYHCPYAKTNVKIDVPKEYDLVFFASVSKMKGIEDLIKAVSIIRDLKPEITLHIIGKGDETYINYLKQLIEELSLTHNIVFKGFIPTQKEMHGHAVKARISVLPTYNDTIPGTIVESMLLGIPVISYSVGGNPDLNRDEEHVILIEPGNVQKLAYEITELLRNDTRQKELAEKALNYAAFEFDNTNSVNHLIHAYKEVISEFKNEH